MKRENTIVCMALADADRINFHNVGGKFFWSWAGDAPRKVYRPTGVMVDDAGRFDLVGLRHGPFATLAEAAHAACYAFGTADDEGAPQRPRNAPAELMAEIDCLAAALTMTRERMAVAPAAKV